MFAVRDKTRSKKIVTRAERTDALDFHTLETVANHRDINEPAEVRRSEVIAQPDINGLAAGKAFTCNNVWRERDNAAVKSASDGWHVIN